MAESSSESLLDEVAKEILTYDSITILYVMDSYFFDPPIDNIYSLKPEEIIKLLDILSNEGYFKKEVIRKPYCNECFSTELVREHICPKCNSPRIIKDRILVHKCGFEGTKKAFIQGNELRCPKCRQKLYVEGEDYFDGGVKYKCLTCGSIFEKPLTRYTCKNCGTKYYGKPPEMIVLSYVRIAS